MSIPPLVQASLNAAGIVSGSPGWAIVDAARLLPGAPARGGTGPVQLTGTPGLPLLRQLMKAFYDYGRMHFTWSQTSSAAAGNGGMMKTGGPTSGACGSLNWNLKYLAEACGLSNIKAESFGSQFVTMPGGVCIDARWAGNVRTERDAFQQFKAFKFSGHHWLSYQGWQHDVCFNKVFQSPDEIVWTRLNPADPSAQKDAGVRADQIYKLAKPQSGYDHLVMLQQLGPCGWPSWQLVSRAQLRALRR